MTPDAIPSIGGAIQAKLLWMNYPNQPTAATVLQHAIGIKGLGLVKANGDSGMLQIFKENLLTRG